MKMITEQALHAQFSLAAYADLEQGVPNIDSLIRKAGFSKKQADEFIRNFSVVAQYNHTETIPAIDEITGEVTDTIESSKGLSVTVFNNQGDTRRFPHSPRINVKEEGGDGAYWKWLTIGAFALLLAGCEKAQLDEQVRELCAADGGVKVYETVTLPSENFDKFGQLKFYKPSQGANALGPEYIYKEERQYFRRGNPEMWRTHVQVFRRSDMKLLGESVFYTRRGGDMPGPWHDSSFICPEPKYISMVEKVFVEPEKGD